ncbi:MAG TPA: cytochrome c oxidase assembly protein [Actinomycetota bacterium]|nr:cytochrome c oxidase assembly protein [Actinomycetota bacterium]
MQVVVVTLAHGTMPAVDPRSTFVVVLVASAGVAYAVLTVRTRSGIGIPSTGRVVAFFGGLAAVAVVDVPLVAHAASERLSAHMAQHLLLWIVAPALLVMGRPGTVVMIGLPLPLRRRAHRIALSLRPITSLATHPAVVLVVSAGVIWAWHMPRAYQAAINDGWLHAVEHVTFLGTAILLWSVLAGYAAHRRRRRPAVFGVAFATMVHSGWLGLVLSFADNVLYPVYASEPGALADQQLAGVLMWIPMALVYSAVAAALFFRWLSDMDRRVSANIDRPAVLSGDGR